MFKVILCGSDDETCLRLKIGTKIYAYSISKDRLLKVRNCPRVA